jgi:hypothetical protein
MFIATINEFNGKKVTIDRSGNAPLILNVLAGKCPSKRLISQGWADTQGMEVGKTYLIEDVELDAHPEHGRQFQFNKVQQVSAVDIMEFAAKFPKQIFNVSSVEESVTEKAFKAATEEY